jgi:predicted nucleic acid-binding protein
MWTRAHWSNATWPKSARPGCGRLLAHPAQYVIYTAALSQVEVISALQRRVRDGSLEVTQAQRLAHRVTIHFAQRYQVIALTQAIVDQACVGLQAHPLRAADAIHLACALTIRRITQEQGLPPPSFVVADTALRAAATRRRVRGGQSAAAPLSLARGGMRHSA